MAENTEDKKAQASTIVRNHMVGSVASSLLPFPLLSVGILGGVQLRMLSKLANLYDVTFSEQRAQAIIGSLAGISMTATAAGLLRMLPGMGQVLGVVGGFTLPPAATYALGQLFIQHFESGGTFLTFDAERAQKDYDAKVEEGKKLMEQNYAGIRP